MESHPKIKRSSCVILSRKADYNLRVHSMTTVHNLNWIFIQVYGKV